MIELNYDYSSLYENIDEIEKYLLENKDDLSVLNFYKYFADFFPIKKNLKLYFLSTDLLNRKVESVMNDIYSKRIIYKKTVDLFYQEIKRKLKAITNDYKTVSPVISSKEQLEILKLYFKTTDEELEKIFFEYQKDKKIFHQPYSVGLGQTSGNVFYNPFSKEPILFLERVHDPIFSIAMLAHEFGHVFDFMSYNKCHSSEETDFYGMISPYSEVNATYYEFKLYEFLLKNGLYSDAVKKQIYMCMCEGYLKDFSTLSKLNDASYVSIEEKENIKNSVMYGYGLMIALAMLDDNDKYSRFQEIREPYFNKKRLDLAGFDDSNISKVMVKKIKNYFEK